MRELTDEASILLKNVFDQLRDGFGRVSVDVSSPERDYYSELKSADMIDCIGAWGQPVVVVTGVTAKGVEHINALKQACVSTGFPLLSLSADRTIRRIVQAVQRFGSLPNVDPELIDAYRELSSSGMLKVFYADNTVYALIDITELAKRYVNEGIIEGRPMEVNISPVFNTEVSASAQASATAVITVTAALKAIDESDLADEDKDALKESIDGIEEAAGNKDKGKFLEALEKVASIAKNSTDVAGVVIPLIMKFGAGFIG